MITKFYDYWIYARWIAVIVSIVLFVILTCRGHAHTLEVEYVGPGSDAYDADKPARERENKAAYERESRNDPNRSDKEKERDARKASDYVRDNFS